MKQLILLVCLFGISLFQLSCKKEEEDTKVQIRVRNASNYQFEAVQVLMPSGQHAYGTLNAGQSSNYATYSEAFRYAAVKVKVNGQDLEWIPTDYVGETPLQPGKYTYLVGITDIANGRLGLRLEQ
ncbi:hypothetical protein ACFPAF_12190 [Hymenobacter endophyticus]|uniref:DUF4625 domain-containing protein n=1 Tax=Hymenobacter endophyticus TaxID=3076335 RepID=A0ABU3TIV6_9BACT|nr:hypothetical protein [Hymenobacter endophyticus]MDU0371160.1 hypothetical protein [Hymenobacter endophyticus]